jgi:TIR domain
MNDDRVSAPLLFYSYAHEDEACLTGLRTHLSLLKRENKISEWYDRKIGAGQDWDLSIREQLERARVVLLLVSADFIASDYCWGTEVRSALEKRERNEGIAVPVIVRPTDWHSAPFGMLKALPTDGKPVTTWRNRDQAWADVAAGIRALIDGLSR